MENEKSIFSFFLEFTIYNLCHLCFKIEYRASSFSFRNFFKKYFLLRFQTHLSYPKAGIRNISKKGHFEIFGKSNMSRLKQSLSEPRVISIKFPFFRSHQVFHNLHPYFYLSIHAASIILPSCLTLHNGRIGTKGLLVWQRQDSNLCHL